MNSIALIAAIFCVVVWSATYIWTEKLTEKFKNVEIVLIRSIIAFIALLMLRFPLKDAGIIALSNWKTNFWQEGLFLTLGLTGQYLFQTLSAKAVRKSDALTVSIISAFEPSLTTIAVIALALIIPGYFLMPSINLMFIAGILLAIVASILKAFINNKDRKNVDNRSRIHLVLLPLIATSVYVVYAVLLGLVDTSYNVFAVTRRTFFYGILIMLAINTVSLVREKINLISYVRDIFSRILSSPEVVINLLILGILASAVCFTFWQFATLQIGAVPTNLLLALTPLGTFVVDLLYYKKFNWISLTSSLIASVGCGIAVYFTH